MSFRCSSPLLGWTYPPPDGSAYRSSGVQWAEFRDAKHDLFQQTGGDILLLEGGSMETLLLTDGGAGGYVPPGDPDGEDEAI